MQIDNFEETFEEEVFEEELMTSSSKIEVENPHLITEKDNRSKAIKALAKARELERKRLKEGYRYVKCEDGVKRLKKP